MKYTYEVVLKRSLFISENNHPPPLLPWIFMHHCFTKALFYPHLSNRCIPTPWRSRWCFFWVWDRHSGKNFSPWVNQTLTCSFWLTYWICSHLRRWASPTGHLRVTLYVRGYCISTTPVMIKHDMSPLRNVTEYVNPGQFPFLFLLNFQWFTAWINYIFSNKCLLSVNKYTIYF